MADGRARGQPVIGIEIYMEGGGNRRDGRVALRQGMDALLAPLKRAAGQKALRWKLSCCGSRNDALRAFRNAAATNRDVFVVLLVDAEGPVSQSPREHLASRDRWDVAFADEDALHLMVQVMETWIVADPDALAAYYGQGFRPNALPGAQNLEPVSKLEVERALHRATEHTRKGRYHKIRHARHLLHRIDSGRVRSRCGHCERLFNTIDAQIEAA